MKEIASFYTEHILKKVGHSCRMPPSMMPRATDHTVHSTSFFGFQFWGPIVLLVTRHRRTEPLRHYLLPVLSVSLCLCVSVVHVWVSRLGDRRQRQMFERTNAKRENSPSSHFAPTKLSGRESSQNRFPPFLRVSVSPWFSFLTSVLRPPRCALSLLQGLLDLQIRNEFFVLPRRR